MPAIRSMSTVAQKWATNAGQAGQSYANGVQSPKADWATNAAAGQGNWSQGVQAAAAAKTFSKGVTKAGTGKWQAQAVAKGVSRYPQGVAGAQSAYQAGFEPYANVIQSTTLPPKFAKGDPRNLQRVTAMSQALRSAKTQSK